LQRATIIVSLNPAIDVEWRVDHAWWEEKNQVLEERRWAGGKGINVARWVRLLGSKPHLILPLGGGSGQELARYLRRERLRATIVPLSLPTRANVVITTPLGRQMRFNPRGPILSRAEWNAIVKAIRSSLATARCLVLSGALPRGAPPDAYAQLIRLAHLARAAAILDCDGSALVEGLKARPFLVKPNVFELSQWAGASLTSEAAIRGAALAMSASMKGWVLVSRGARGAMLVNKSQGFAETCPAPKSKVLNTIGAGDALLAGAVRAMELGRSPSSWLRYGVTVGTTATRCMAGLTPKVGPSLPR
jgi:1-phosphofructokinase